MGTARAGGRAAAGYKAAATHPAIAPIVVSPLASRNSADARDRPIGFHTSHPQGAYKCHEPTTAHGTPTSGVS